MGRDGRQVLARLAARRLAAKAASPDFLASISETEFQTRLVRFEFGLGRVTPGSAPILAPSAQKAQAQRIARGLTLLGPARTARVLGVLLASRRATGDDGGADKLEAHLATKAWWRERATGGAA